MKAASYGLGSTLAVRREALQRIGGLATLVDHLADDYELGARIDHAGYRIALSASVVKTAIPAYSWRGFFYISFAGPAPSAIFVSWGYSGLIFTHGLAWAILNVVASGLSPLSVWLLALSFFSAWRWP